MNSKEKTHLLIDCDGVLLDPVLGFSKWVLFNFPKIDIVNIFKNNLDFVNCCIFCFYGSKDFSNLPTIKLSVDAINYLKQYYKLDVITTCGDNKQIREDRINNLEKKFGKHVFNEIYTLPRSSSKDVIYKLYPNTIIIDDELPNIIDAKKCNLNHKLYWMKYHTLFKDLFINKYDKSEKNNYKETNWDNIIKEIKTFHISK